MKILILTQAVDTQESILGFFHRWIEEYAAQAEQVTVICLREGAHALPDNVKVLSLGKEKGVSRIGYVCNFFKYIFRERQQYDVVFVHMNQIYVLLGGIFWRLWGKKIGLWYAHGHVPISLRFATFLTHHILTSTESGFRLPTKKKHVVGQGIDASVFSCDERDVSETLRLIYVGRISPIKDIKTLLRAYSVLQKEGKQLSLTLVGGATLDIEKTYKKELEEYIETEGLRGITFAGAIPNDALPTHLCEADVFINPSHTGSLDKTGLEAMSAGLVLLTCNEAYEAVLGEHRDTLMFKKGDEEDLIAHLRPFFSVERRVEMGLKLRDIVVREHSIKGLVGKISTILTS
jgi:glycosyltransferase involved in cell wall biosynthesis